jgi:hypothetical protein
LRKQDDITTETFKTYIAMKQRTVAHALDNRTWVSDIMGHLRVQVIVEYIQIWNLVDGIMLQQVTDHHVWKLSNTGIYTSKLAYKAFFTGAIQFASMETHLEVMETVAM